MERISSSRLSMDLYMLNNGAIVSKDDIVERVLWSERNLEFTDCMHNYMAKRERYTLEYDGNKPVYDYRVAFFKLED